MLTALIILKTVERSLTPSSRRSTAKASLESKGGTASCSCRSSSAYASLIRSVRMLSACPSLMKKGPSDTITSRSLPTCFTSSAEPDSSLPDAADAATPASQPPDALAIWKSRVSTAPGRLLK